ncbi:MAG: peptidoglycan endopeptidase [Prosthecobacter sp.]
MPRLALVFLTLPCCLLLCQCGSKAGLKWEYGFVPGKTGIIIDGKAVPPANAPADVLRAISAGNSICRKPYRRGGGHAKFEDSAYDCSGAVSYVLHAAGELDAPTVSSAFRSYGKSGAGKWISVYARKGHVFMEVAGLRFDTGYSDADSSGPRWSTRSRPTKGYSIRHPSGL